jgi:hypothetical protein
VKRFAVCAFLLIAVTAANRPFAAFAAGGLPSVVMSPSPAPSVLQTSISGTPLPASVPTPGAPDIPIVAPVSTPIAPAAPMPTPVPLTVSTSALVMSYGMNIPVQAFGVYGNLTAVSVDPTIARIAVSQDSRQIGIEGIGIGSTVVNVQDARGMKTSLAVSVELPAGSVAPTASIRITGAPASALFVAEQATQAALLAAKPGQGASVRPGASPPVTHELDIDGIADVAVPVSIRGTGLYPVDAITHVRVENFAQPHVHPASLLVSDFPERLHENGLLYTAVLKPEEPTRLLFYHANPTGAPHRWIVLQATNRSEHDAHVTIVDGHGGPNPNEMAVGHLSTERFLIRESQNEGSFVTIPAHATVGLITASLPPGNVVSDLVQLRQIDGEPLSLALSAQDSPEANAALNADAELLTDTVKHARGRYPIPEFFYEATYDTSAQPLEIPIGQLPLPNLRQGIALAGDYGVLFSVSATLINSGNKPSEVALYATPRGGRATATFLIDRALVQAHSLPSYSHFKVKQYTVPAHGFVNVNIVTMPEGGSSYPVNLIFAPDDGTVSPGAPGSPIY